MFKKEMNPRTFFRAIKIPDRYTLFSSYYTIRKKGSEVPVKIWSLLNENSENYIVFFDFPKT